MKKLYIITGAAGHLGSTIIKLLESRNQKARGLILPSESAENTKNTTYYKGDVTLKIRATAGSYLSIPPE